MIRRILIAAALSVVPLSVVAQDNEGPSRDQLLKVLGYYRDIPLQAIKTGAIDERRQKAAYADAGDEEITCLTPVFPDAELANSDAAKIADATDFPEEVCEDISKMHRQLIELQKLDATGAGSWKPGCLSRYPQHHAVRYFVRRDSFPAWTKAEVSDAWINRVAAAGTWQLSYQQAKSRFGGMSHLDASIKLGMDMVYAVEGCGHFETDNEGEAHIIVKSLYIPGSTIGYAYFNNTQCSDVVTLNIDNSWHPNEDSHAYAHLFAHEAGHNNNLQHQFANQSRTKEIMSYNPPQDSQGYTILYGYSDGNAPHVLPRAPSKNVLVRFYGGEPFPGTNPEPPDPTPPTGDFPYEAGDTKIEITLGRKLTWELKSIEGDDGPSLSKRIQEEFAKIPDYGLKDTHRQLIGLIYAQVAESVRKGEVNIDDANKAIKQTREAFLGMTGDLDKWKEVFKVADSAPTAQGMNQVAAGLIGNDFIPPELVALINKIIDDVFAERPLVRAILKAVLILLSNQNGEKFVDPDGVGVVPVKPVAPKEPVKTATRVELRGSQRRVVTYRPRATAMSPNGLGQSSMFGISGLGRR